MVKRKVSHLQIKLMKLLTSKKLDYLFVCHYILYRISPERDASSIVLDDDLMTDRVAGQLRQEQELEEPTTTNNDQSTEEQRQDQQQEQQQEEDEERECLYCNTSKQYCFIQNTF